MCAGMQKKIDKHQRKYRFRIRIGSVQPSPRDSGTFRRTRKRRRCQTVSWVAVKIDWMSRIPCVNKPLRVYIMSLSVPTHRAKMKAKANFSFVFFWCFTPSLPLSLGVNGPLEVINPHGYVMSRIPRLLILLLRHAKLCYVTCRDSKGILRRSWNVLWRRLCFFQFRFWPIFKNYTIVQIP